MKKIILVANDAEDTGKSLLSALLGLYLERRGVQHTQVQTDEDDPQDTERQFLDIEYGPDTAEVISLADMRSVTVIDLATGGGEGFFGYLQDSGVLELFEEMEAELTVLIPVDGTEESIDGAVAIADQFGADAQYLIAHNTALGGVEKEDYWDETYAAKTFGFLGAQEMIIPDLFDGGDLEDLATKLAQGVRLTLGGKKKKKEDPLTQALGREVDGCFVDVQALITGSNEESPYGWRTNKGSLQAVGKR